MILLFFLIQADTLQLSLDEALQRAFHQSPTFLSSQVDRAQGYINLAKGLSVLLPTPQASISQTITEPSVFSNNSWSGSVGVSQILADLGLIPGIIQAVHLSEFYKFQSRDKTNKLAFDVKSGYYAIIKTCGLVEAAQQALKQANESVRLIEEKYRLGQVAKIDLLRAQVFASQGEINVLSAQQGLEAANEELKATLGIMENVLIKPTDELSAPAEVANANFDLLLARLENKNPNLAASYEFERQAKAGLWTAESRILPNLSLFARSNYSDSLFPKSVRYWQDHDVVSYGLDINFPIFDLKSVLINISDARNGSKSATIQRLSAELTLKKALKVALIDFQDAQERSTYARKNLELSEEVERLGLEQLRLGVLSLIDLLDVETKLTQARTQYISALCDTYIGKAQLEYLIGEQ
jgi:outer membrane protein TolC